MSWDWHYLNSKYDWRAQTRRELIIELWESYRGDNKNWKTLDFGCGAGLLMVEIKSRNPGGRVAGVDVSRKALAYCKREKLTDVKLYLGKTLPYQRKTFDLVTAIDVLEHVQDDAGSLAEIYRVMVPGGLGIFMVPARMELWSTRDIRLGHFRRYVGDELESKARSVGFKVLASKNIDFGLYFGLKAMCLGASKKGGVPDLSRDTSLSNTVMDKFMLRYQRIENWVQSWITFPIGITRGVVVRRPA